MKKLLFFFTALIASVLAFARIAPGDNLLSNGVLYTDRTDTPPMYWSAQSDTKFFEYSPSGGPEDKSYVKLVNLSDTPAQESSLRQYDLKLVTGGKYKLSAKVRTIDFHSPHCGLLVCNNGWTKSAGFQTLPANQDWTLMETEIIVPETTKDAYFFAIFASQFTGEADFADVKLEALSADALEGSTASGLANACGKAMLVPWEPLLTKIAAADRKATFKLFGSDTANAEKYDLLVSFSDTADTVKQPLVKGINTVILPETAKSGIMTLIVLDREDGEKVFELPNDYEVVNVPQVAPGAQKRLNNLCTEILNQPILARKAAQEFHFSTLKTGWIFLAAQNAMADDLEIILDGQLTVIKADTPRLENFREVGIGEHTLTVTGAVNGGNMVVRSIAETLNYCPGTNGVVPENPPYDWDFQVKYGLPAITTQNGGSIPDDKVDWFHGQGYKWLANLNTSGLKSNDELTGLLNGSAGMSQDKFDGVTCDEQFFNQPMVLARYTKGLRAYKNTKNHLIYSWIVGKPATPGIDEDYVSATLNASHGRGKLLIENYCRTQPDEAAVMDYLDLYITETVRRYRRLFPHAVESLGVILGNFNQVPVLSLHHHPEVDMKYYLDMQFNLLANDPAFEGLATVGYWGSYYADHEFHRWSYMLLRHYVVEGHTEMLSEKYGFSYIPGHVINGDFVGSFDGWTTNGNVSLDKVNDFANTSQNRWGGNHGVGDTFAVFTKKADEISTATQIAKNLVPGKAYLLEFCTFDVDYVKNHISDWRDFGIRAVLGEGAEIRQDLSWQHIDKRGDKGRYAHNNGVARPNLHHIVFIATQPEVEITLNNALAAPGEKLGVNYFSVTPFLLEE